MDLKTKDGMMLVHEVEYKRLTEAQTLVPILRNSISKSWRLLDRFQKLLTQDFSTSAQAA